MRRALLVIGLVCLAVATASAQDAAPEENPALSRGELASLLLKVGQPQSPRSAPETALRQCKDLGLVPVEWTAEGIATHGDLAEVVGRYGVIYAPADSEDPVSQVFAEAFLRRNIGKLREFIGASLGHEASASHVMDEGIDRAVSPLDFQ